MPLYYLWILIQYLTSYFENNIKSFNVETLKI